MEKNNRASKRTFGLIFSIIAICIVIAAVLAFFMNGKRTDNSDGDTNVLIGILTCTSNTPKEPFFTLFDEIGPSHKIKVTFRGGKYDKFNYTYDAKFDSEKKVEQALSALRAKYNRYMVSIKMDQESLSPTFSGVNDELLINLYIERQNLTVGTGKFALLSEKEFDDIDRFNVDDFKRMYAGKGFACQYEE